MSMTVHEVAKLSGVSVKTLYHYQKKGLLAPERIAENGYRLYGERELERLQQILFYRELDFPLAEIKSLLDGKRARADCLREQRNLLDSRRRRLDAVIATINETIAALEKGENMSIETLFNGLNKEEWDMALKTQNDYLQKRYGFALGTDVDADEMNIQAREASDFMNAMAAYLKTGGLPDDADVAETICKHVGFLNGIHGTTVEGFAGQANYLASDAFHRNMMENMQSGLSDFISSAAAKYAAATN